MEQNLAELAKSIDLPHKTTKHIIKMLKHDLLLSMYRKEVTDSNLPAIKEQLAKLKNSEQFKTNEEFIVREVKSLEAQIKGIEERTEWNLEMNKRVANTYKKWFNKEFNPEIHNKHKSPCFFLMGPPGHGKTTAYMVASKELCADMGLRFVPHVSGEYIPRKDDFIMVVQECAGENSAITFAGVPKAETIVVDGKERSVLKRALNYRFTVFDQVAGGVLLFDDAANAAQVIQNVLLPVTQNHTFQEAIIKNACVGLTGNLGALDGTYTSELSSALKTRVIGVFTMDTVDDFIDRCYKDYNDELGAGMIDVYLKRNPQDFAKLPDSNKKSGHATPRTWEQLVQLSRSAIERHGGRGRGEEAAMEELQVFAPSQVGPEIGHKLHAFFTSWVTGADPIARKMIIDNDFEKAQAEFNSKYKGGSSQEDITFGYQFATACGDYVVNEIAKAPNDDKKFEEMIVRFGKATLKVNESEFSYALDHLKNKMAAQITTLSEQVKDNKRELNNNVREQIAMTIAKNPDCSKSRRDILIKVITDFHTLAASSVISSKRGGRAGMSRD